eukprot:3561773-Lingulodinium_polyedra.AAC.1
MFSSRRTQRPGQPCGRRRGRIGCRRPARCLRRMLRRGGWLFAARPAASTGACSSRASTARRAQ